jgi:hypothetical protein
MELLLARIAPRELSLLPLDPRNVETVPSERSALALAYLRAFLVPSVLPKTRKDKHRASLATLDSLPRRRVVMFARRANQARLLTRAD